MRRKSLRKLALLIILCQSHKQENSKAIVPKIRPTFSISEQISNAIIAMWEGNTRLLIPFQFRTEMKNLEFREVCHEDQKLLAREDLFRIE